MMKDEINLEGYKSFYFNEGYEKGRKDMLTELAGSLLLVVLAALLIWEFIL